MIYKQLPNIKQYNRNGDKIDPFCGNFEMPVFSEVAYSGDYYDLSNIPDITSSDNSISITRPFSNDSDVNSFDLTLNTSTVELIDFTNFHNYYIREVTDWTSENDATIKHYVVDNVLTGEELTIVDTSQAGDTNTSYKSKFKFERNTTGNASVYIPMICVDATDFEALVNVKIEFADEGAFNTNVFILADTPGNFSWCFAKNVPFNIEGKRNVNQLLAFIEVPSWFTGSIEISIKRLHIQLGSNIFSYKNDANASLGYSYASFNSTNEYDVAVFTDLTGFTDIYPTSNDNYGVLDVDFFVDSVNTLEIQSDNSIPDWIVNTLYTNEVALRNRMNEIILRNTQLNFDNYYTKPEVYTKTEIDQKLAGNVKREIVSELPQTGVDGTIYMVPSATAATGDVYDEYMWLSTQGQVAAHFEKIGTTKADLANYYTKTEVDTALNAKQDTLTFDTTPTANSTKPVTSGGIKTALNAKQGTITVATNTSTPTDNDTIIMQADGVSNTTTFIRRKLSYLWNWIKTKGDQRFWSKAFFEINFSEYNIFGYKTKIISPMSENALYAADLCGAVVEWKTYNENDEVILDKSSEVYKLFQGNIENINAHPLTGEYDILTIDMTSMTDVVSKIGEGFIMLYFRGSSPASIPELSIMRNNQNSWVAVTGTEGIKLGTRYLTYTYTIEYRDVRKIKVKVVGKSGTESSPNYNGSSIGVITYWRNSGLLQMKPIVTKYPVKQDLYGDVEAPKFIKRGGTSQQVLLADGTTINMPSAPGTNKDTLLKNLISGLTYTTTDLTDTTEIVASYSGADGFGTSGFVNVPFKRRMVKVWDYIKSKADSIYVSTAASQGLNSTAKSNAKANIGLDNVDNTSDATKKTNFTGSIASSNTGFVTGGDVYTALNSRYKSITVTNDNYTDASLFNDVKPGDVINLDVLSLSDDNTVDIAKCNHCFIILGGILEFFKLKFGAYNIGIHGNLQQHGTYIIGYMENNSFYILSNDTGEVLLRLNDNSYVTYSGGITSNVHPGSITTIVFSSQYPITKLVMNITNEKDLLILNPIYNSRLIQSFGDTQHPSDTTKCSTFNGFFPATVIQYINYLSWEELFLGCGFSLDNDYIVKPISTVVILKKAFYYAYSYNSHVTNVDFTGIISNVNLTSCFESADGFNVILDGKDLTLATCTDMFKDAKNITISAIGCNQDTIDKINANISGSYTSTITVITTDPNA